METEIPPADQLLEHAAFLRALARSLVFDDAQADDVVQQTLTAAIDRPPARHVPLRAWLARVVKNRARMLRRSEGRRARRERAAATPEAVAASPAEIAVRLETQRRVAEAVLALEEPYRSTVFLRYFEDLTPTEIAHRLDVSVDTAKTRLKRALRTLRGRLDETAGGRRAWMAALAPLALPRAAAAATATGAAFWGGLLAMKAFWMSSVVVALVAALWVMQTSHDGDTSPRGFATPSGGAATKVRDGSAASGRDTTETAQEPANPVARARRGVVRDADGKPIADASATLLEWRYAVGWKAVRRLAASDAGGRLRFEAPGSRGVRVRISHPNYLRKEQQFDAGSEATVVLERGSPLTVVVRGPDGEPVPGAHVVAHETASAMEWDIYSKRPVLTQEEYCNGVTGETGSCVVGAVPVGHAGIRIEHPRYARHRAWVAVESVDATRHEIVLRYGATVTGRVTGPGGTPVAKARVWIRDHEARFALTDAGGTYELTHVGPGTVHVFAGADGFAPAAFGMSSGWGDAVPVRVADRKTVTGIDVALLLGAHVAGRVVDDTGQPLAGVFVRVRARVEPGGIATVRTGADGAFRAGPLALRAKTGIYVDFATPAMTIPSAHRSLAPGRTLDLGDVVGRRPGRVEGRVEIGWDESRAVYVEAIPAGERYLARTGRVAADGTFSMAVPAGEVAIVARVDGADDVASASRTVKIEANGTTDGVTLTLLRTFPITGRVETADGTPLPNLAVGAYGPDRLAHLTTTDETGAFHFGPLPEGEYKVGVANAARHEVPENTETVPAGARDVKIVVQQPNQKVAGRVLVERTGQPVADFEVSLLRYDTFFPKHVASRRIRSGDGRFTIPADKPGRYAIEIAADDHATHRTPAFRVEADASFEIGDVKVKAPAQLVGVVRNATGLPVPYARVYVVNFKMQANDDAPWTDSNGQYRIPKLDPGAYTLFVVSPRHPLAMVRGVTVTAGEVTERDVALSAASPLLLRIVDAQGAPIKDAALTYTFPGLAPLNSKLLAGYEPPGYGSNRSGADGRIKKPSMPAAIISVTIEKDGFVTGRRDVELVAGEPREVEIRLERKPVR